MADTIITTDGLANLAAQIQDTKYETTVRDFQNKDYISDKLTQQFIANETKSDLVSSHTDSAIRSLDGSNEHRTTRTADQVMNRAEFIDQGAARRFDASTLAAALNATSAVNALERSTDRINDQTIKSEGIIHNELDWLKNEARQAVAAQNLQNYALMDKVRDEGAVTRALMNQQYTDNLRDKLSATQNTLVEIRGDVRHWEHEGRRWDRDFNTQNVNSITSSINALHSQFQQATQGTVNFGSMSGNAGRNTSTNNVV